MALPLRSLALTLPLALLLSGCWLDGSTTRHDGSGTVIADAPATDQAIALGIIRLVNETTTDVTYLDGLDLDVLAATGIVARRQGDDGQDGTADDRPFESLTDLYELDPVDADTVDRLADAAFDEDLVPVASIEGVLFSASELDLSLQLANEETAEDLQDLGLDRRSANSIVNGRPFESLRDAADEPHIGPGALELLRDAAGTMTREEAT